MICYSEDCLKGQNNSFDFFLFTPINPLQLPLRMIRVVVYCLM